MSAIHVFGLGNVGRTLERTLDAHGHASSDGDLAKMLTACPENALVFLCWPEAIVRERSPIFKKIRRHYVSVSGSLEPAELKALGIEGVFHPLFGFSSAGSKSLSGVPIGISASTPTMRKMLE